jgi:hypothetical protein
LSAATDAASAESISAISSSVGLSGEEMFRQACARFRNAMLVCFRGDFDQAIMVRLFRVHQVILGEKA